MLELIGVDGLTQWDVGRQVKVDKDIDMVHFSNRPYGYSKNVKVTDGVADVPDMFLTSCAPLRVWAYVGDFEKGYTKIEKIYEVKPKNRPEDYIYTPEEVKTWEQLQSEIGDLAGLETEAKENLVVAINEAAKSGGESYTLPQATAEAIGGVKADSAEAADTQPVRIGEDGKLYTAPCDTDISLGLTSAAVGQTIKVKAIDDTGKPTEWEAADMSKDIVLDTTLTQSGQAADAKAVGDALAEKQPKGDYLTHDNLQSATDAALEQAKASGEFDGPQGPAGPAGADGKDGAGIDITGATVGQIAKITAVDESGKPTAWEAADMQSGDRWELINAIEIPDGTEETNALTISADKNGNAFSLKKARLITYFPKYTGESSIPGYSFTMINGFVSGPQSPLCYTSGLPFPNKSQNPEGWLEVDLSMPGYEVERVARFAGSGGRPAENMFWGARRLNGAETITSIGGTNMLIYPGCKFTLYGVRA